MFVLFDYVDCLPVNRQEEEIDGSPPLPVLSPSGLEVHVSDVNPPDESSICSVRCHVPSSVNGVLSAQLMIRQQLSVISNATYNVENLDFLQLALDGLRRMADCLDGAQLKSPTFKLTERRCRIPKFKRQRTMRIRNSQRRLWSNRYFGRKKSTAGWSY
jgi:hypothetical protein